PLVELQVSLPHSLTIEKEAFERLLSGLSNTSTPLSFEIVGLPGSIKTQIACAAADCEQILQQVEAYFPEAVIEERTHFLSDLWDRSGTRGRMIIDCGLSNEFMLPLRTFQRFDIDPLIAVTGALSDLQEDELAILQVVFRPVRYSWKESILSSVTDESGRSVFVDSPQMASLAKQKVSKPLYAVVLRLAAQSLRQGRAWQITKSLGGALVQLADPQGNELIPLSNDDYLNEEHEQDLIFRQTHRSGMILNADELVGLVHFPSASVKAEKLDRRETRTKAAPTISSGHPFMLGENHHAGRTNTVSLNADQRSRHTYLVGASGTGKSTLLLNMILQD
ncbi:MAG: hypothetical protein P8Y94_18100, partial [Acidobacteriota bacterium]